MKKIIFLDFDGVITLEEKHPLFGFANMEFSSECINNLNAIIAQTGAEVVVTSSWRINHSVSALQKLLEDKGFHGKVLDKVPEHEDWFATRDDEIEDWLKKNNQESVFVILDDQPVPKFSDHLVQTLSHQGLIHDSQVQQAVRLLTQE